MDANERKRIAAKALRVCCCEGRYVWSWDSWRVFQETEDRELVLNALVQATKAKIGEDGVRKANWVLSSSAADGLALAAPLALKMNKRLGFYLPSRDKWAGRMPDLQSDYFIGADFAINAGAHLDGLVRTLSRGEATERLLVYAALFDYVGNEVRERAMERLGRIQERIVSLITPADFPERAVMFPEGRGDLSFVAKRVFLEEEFQHMGSRDTGHTTERKGFPNTQFFSVNEWKDFIAGKSTNSPPVPGKPEEGGCDCEK